MQLTARELASIRADFNRKLTDTCYIYEPPDPNTATRTSSGFVARGYPGAWTSVIGSVAIVAAGTGYTAGDLVTLDGGDGLARASILTVDVDGVVLTISLVGTGSGYSMSTYDAVGGSGSGLTISVGPKPFPCRVDEIERFITEQLGPSVVQAVSRYELSFEWDAPVKPTSRIKIASSGNPELVGVSFDVMEAAQQTTEVLHSAICTLTQATSANP